MTKDDAYQRLVSMLEADFQVPRDSISEETKLRTDLGLDSLAVMELVADAEDRFRVTIPNEILTELVTVDDVARAIHRLQGA